MEDKKFQFIYKAEFIPKGQGNKIMFWSSIPQNLTGQEMITLKTNVEPQSSFVDRGNKILYYSEELSATFTYEATYETNLSISDPDSINLTLGDSGDLDYFEYTKSERYTELSESIISLTKDVTGRSQAKIDKLFDIFEYVAKNFTYEYPVARRGVEHLDLCSPKGDCAEYSSLLVAMSRAIGIMARNVTGFVVFEPEGSVMEHGWAQVFTKEAGWVDVDAQYASLENDLVIGKNKYFLKRSEYRLISCIGFNINLNPKVPKEYSVEYVNSLGLEMNRSSVQTLQPVAFAAIGEIIFKDSIVLK